MDDWKGDPLAFGTFRVPDGFVLVCALCGWPPHAEITAGVIRAHFEVEHPFWARRHPGLLNMTLEVAG